MSATRSAAEVVAELETIHGHRFLPWQRALIIQIYERDIEHPGSNTLMLGGRGFGRAHLLRMLDQYNRLVEPPPRSVRLPGE